MFQNLNTFLFLFSNKLLVFRAGIHKILVIIASREDPDQPASYLGLHCLSRPFWQATSGQSFRIFTVTDHCDITEKVKP